MAQNRTPIEQVWSAKGNLPNNAIVATADGKYPALDGSLITGISAGDMSASVYDPTTIQADAFARVNHTGTQLASTISDFDTEVANNTVVASNTAKVPNASTIGTADETTFLRGDNAWATPAGGGGGPFPLVENLGTPLVELKLNTTGPDMTGTLSSWVYNDAKGVHNPIEVADPQSLWNAATFTFTPAEDGVYLFKFDFLQTYLGINAPFFDFPAPEIGVSIDGADYVKKIEYGKIVGHGNAEAFNSFPGNTYEGKTHQHWTPFEIVVSLTAGEAVQLITSAPRWAVGHSMPSVTAPFPKAHHGPVNSPVKIYKL